MRLIFLIIILGACATPTSSSFPLKIELLFSTPLKFQKKNFMVEVVGGVPKIKSVGPSQSK